MCATYSEKEKRTHFQSFANKIYTGIREIEPEYAEKRAIWELFQNALDTVTENGLIEISITEKGLLFKHNGRPFKDDEFGGLIKQYSVGKAYGDNNEQLGQYGTGFISTHVYGKNIVINGSIQTDDGSYRTLQDFKLDRDAIDIENLTDKLIEQNRLIAELCDTITASVKEALPYTSFEYQASKDDRQHIINMLRYIESILLYIFCFNRELNEVTLCDGIAKKEYKRLESSDEVLHISIDNKPCEIPFLYNKDKNVKVIVGNESRVLTDIPKQFLFYPLMNTIDVGYNFIVHANDFKPNKERDYLHKNREKKELKDDIEKNETLLEVAFDLVLNKIKDDENISLIDFAKVEFTEKDNDFDKRLKTKYIDELRELKRIDCNGEDYSISEIEYFDNSILLLPQEVQKSIYTLLTQFRNLPAFEQYSKLSNYVNNWNENIDNKFNALSFDGIGKIIAQDSGGNYDYIKDQKSFQVFISLIGGNINLLNDLELIPNIHGNFKSFENLVKWEFKEPELINIVDRINTSISERFIHQDFEFLENVNTYNRERFKDDFSKFCNELTDSISKEKETLKAGSVKFLMLLETLVNFVALNKKTQLNIDVANFYGKVFALNPHQAELVNPTVDNNYQPTIKLLANLYVRYLDGIDVKKHVLNIKEIVSIMFRDNKLKDELLHKLVCIPNQNYVLKSQTELKCDNVKDNDFKNIYKEITKKDVRDELAYDGFDEFLQHSGSISGSFLGEVIETTLNKDKKFIPVDNLIVNRLLELIEKISGNPKTWGQWLPNIDKVKEEILMYKFQNEKTRTSLFSILTKDEKTIQLLGDLVKIDRLEEIVNKGKERLQEENRKNDHLNYINYIGTTIQNLIQNQLDIELANVVSILKSEEDNELTTQEQQNGQDFIIYKNKKPIYFIEVKSKWDENGRFALSKNQTEKCASEKNKYAVISINVDRYKKKYVIDIDNIPFENLKEFVKVNDELGDNFEKLVFENVSKSELIEPKLIEYRGSIPQKLIDERGLDFDLFIKNLIQIIKQA